MHPRTRYWLPLVLVWSFTGCRLAETMPLAQPLASYSKPGGDDEKILSQAEQDRLTAQDTDELTYQTLPEPGAQGIFPGPPPEDLGNFGALNERLFRGARPTDQGMALLKQKGVTLIVNLENARGPVEHEKTIAEMLGMKFMSIPLGIFLPPRTAKVETFLQAVTDPARPVIYFHCMQGRDRTGTMAFTYRIRQDRWDSKKAYAEMKSYRFHTYLIGINAFVRWYGWRYGANQE